MGLREKVALVLAGLIIILITQTSCVTKAKKKFSAKDFIRLKSKNVDTHHCRNQHQDDPNTQNNDESLYKKYNFPEMTYASGFSPRTYNVFEDIKEKSPTYKPIDAKTIFKNSLNRKSKIKKNNRKNKIENVHKKPTENVFSQEFSLNPSYRDLARFPEVEYPINVGDIWKPNFWNGQLSNLEKNTERSRSDTKPHTWKNNSKSRYKNKIDKSHSYFKQNKTKDELCSKTISYTLATPHPYEYIMTDKNTASVTEASKNKAEEKIPTLTTPLPPYNTRSRMLTITNINNITKENVTDILSESYNNKTNNIDVSKPIERKSEEEIPIGFEEEFTTDIPEFPPYALSTVPPPSVKDMLWEESQILDPYKSISYTDELDDYFIQVKK